MPGQSHSCICACAMQLLLLAARPLYIRNYWHGGETRYNTCGDEVLGAEMVPNFFQPKIGARLSQKFHTKGNLGYFAWDLRGPTLTWVISSDSMQTWQFYGFGGNIFGPPSLTVRVANIVCSRKTHFLGKSTKWLKHNLDRANILENGQLFWNALYITVTSKSGKILKDLAKNHASLTSSGQEWQIYMNILINLARFQWILPRIMQV